MNIRTRLTSIKKFSVHMIERLPPDAAPVALLVLIALVTVTLTFRMVLRHHGRQYVLNSNSAAAKLAAKTFFEPPHYVPVTAPTPKSLLDKILPGQPAPPPNPSRHRQVARPPESIMPSALLRFDTELAERKAAAERNSMQGRIFLTQVADCVSQQSLVAPPDQMKCMFAAHEIKKRYPNDRLVEAEFQRVQARANPNIRTKVEYYLNNREKLLKLGKIKSLNGK